MTPFARNPAVIISPIPLDPPVTTATLPSTLKRSFMFMLPLYLVIEFLNIHNIYKQLSDVKYIMLLMNLLGLVISIAVLVWGADKFVDNSALVAKKFGLSELTIGLTIVALGTSAPEIFVGISSVLSKTEELALGTVIGSNISNIALIFGVSCIGLAAKPIKTSSVQFIAFALSAVVLGIALNDLRISYAESFLLLLVFFIFIFITYKFRSNGLATQDDISSADDGSFKVVLFLLIGLFCLILGSRYAVLHAKEIALILNVSELIIGLTIIAIGTSLPELAATISAILKRKNDMVVGNVIGSNVLNITLVVPIIGFFSNIELNQIIYTRDFFYMMIATISFIAVAGLYSSKLISINLSKLLGVIFVACYLCYILLVSNLL